jgi:hypothetical protein
MDSDNTKISGHHCNLRSTLYMLQLCYYLKSSIFWDTMLCSLLKVHRGFQGTCCLWNTGWLSTDYTTFVSQKTELFTTTAVTTSNSTPLLILRCLFNDYMPIESYCNLFTALYPTTKDDCKYLSRNGGKANREDVVSCCPTFLCPLSKCIDIINKEHHR